MAGEGDSLVERGKPRYSWVRGVGKSLPLVSGVGSLELAGRWGVMTGLGMERAPEEVRQWQGAGGSVCACPSVRKLDAAWGGGSSKRNCNKPVSYLSLSSTWWLLC